MPLVVAPIGKVGELLLSPLSGAISFGTALATSARSAYRAMRSGNLRPALETLRGLAWQAGAEGDRWYLPPIGRWAGAAVGTALGMAAGMVPPVGGPLGTAVKRAARAVGRAGYRAGVAATEAAMVDVARTGQILTEASEGAVEALRRFAVDDVIDEATGRPVRDLIIRGERTGFVGFNWQMRPWLRESLIPVSVVGGAGLGVVMGRQEPVILPDRPYYGALPGLVGSVPIDDMGASGDVVFALNNMRNGW